MIKVSHWRAFLPVTMFKVSHWQKGMLFHIFSQDDNTKTKSSERWDKVPTNWHHQIPATLRTGGQKILSHGVRKDVPPPCGVSQQRPQGCVPLKARATPGSGSSPQHSHAGVPCAQTNPAYLASCEHTSHNRQKPVPEQSANHWHAIFNSTMRSSAVQSQMLLVQNTVSVVDNCC
jgi:hypothetical protein